MRYFNWIFNPFWNNRCILDVYFSCMSDYGLVRFRFIVCVEWSLRKCVCKCFLLSFFFFFIITNVYCLGDVLVINFADRIAYNSPQDTFLYIRLPPFAYNCSESA